MGVWGGGRDWQWYKGEQTMVLTWAFPRGPPGGMGWLLAYLSPSLMAGRLEWESTGVTFGGTAQQAEIGWLKHQLKGWLHPGRGSQKTPMGHRLSWQRSFPPLCLAQVSPAGIRSKAWPKAPLLPGQSVKRPSPFPGSPPLLNQWPESPWGWSPHLLFFCQSWWLIQL